MSVMLSGCQFPAIRIWRSRVPSEKAQVLFGLNHDACRDELPYAFENSRVCALNEQSHPYTMLNVIVNFP